MKIYVRSSSSSNLVGDLHRYGPGMGYHDEYEDTFDMDEDTESFLYSAADAILEDIADNSKGSATEFNYLKIDGYAYVDDEKCYFSINAGDILSDIEKLRKILRDYDTAENFWYKHIEPMYVEYYKDKGEW